MPSGSYIVKTDLHMPESYFEVGEGGTAEGIWIYLNIFQLNILNSLVLMRKIKPQNIST